MGAWLLIYPTSSWSHAVLFDMLSVERRITSLFDRMNTLAISYLYGRTQRTIMIDYLAETRVWLWSQIGFSAISNMSVDGMIHHWLKGPVSWNLSRPENHWGDSLTWPAQTTKTVKVKALGFACWSVWTICHCGWAKFSKARYLMCQKRYQWRRWCVPYQEWTEENRQLYKDWVIARFWM
jgi:hypothetical protein